MTDDCGSPRPAFSLKWLLRPIAVDDFLRTHWERRPLAVGRAAPEYFEWLPDLDAVDELITATSSGPTQPADDGSLVRADRGRLSQRRFRVRGDSIPDVQDIYRAYHDGYSIVLNRLHRRSASVARLCRALETDLHHPVGANMYLTPRAGQGFLPHVDTHDVFILQLHGVKEWHIASADHELPLTSASNTAVTPMLGSQTFILRRGDVLYIPRGYPHEAVASDSSSLHLTVGVHVYRWVDLVTAALGVVAEKRLDLRKALPPGFLDVPMDTAHAAELVTELASALVDGDVAEQARVRLAANLLDTTKAADPGHFRSIDAIGSLTADSIVTRAPSALCRVRSGDQEAIIEFAGNYVCGPVSTQPALTFVAERHRFAVRDLPGALSTQDKLELVGRLISEGLLHHDSGEGPTMKSGDEGRGGACR